MGLSFEILLSRLLQQCRCSNLNKNVLSHPLYEKISVFELQINHSTILFHYAYGSNTSQGGVHWPYSNPPSSVPDCALRAPLLFLMYTLLPAESTPNIINRNDFFFSSPGLI